MGNCVSLLLNVELSLDSWNEPWVAVWYYCAYMPLGSICFFLLFLSVCPSSSSFPEFFWVIWAFCMSQFNLLTWPIAYKVKVKFAQSCLTLCDPMNYTVHGILQVGILEWGAVPFSRGSSQPRDGTQVSHIAGGFFTIWGTREAQEYWSG